MAKTARSTSRRTRRSRRPRRSGRARFGYQRLGVRRVSGKNGSCDKRVVDRELAAFKRGQLYSGSGQRVTQRKQAVAIALSIARKECPGPRGRPQNRGARATSRRG